jgi:endonuclease/exonuclease/phosphatase (EEP) superfamily protein YafD
VLVVNQGGNNKSEERNNAKRVDLRTQFVVQLVFLQEHDPLLLAGREWDGTEWLEVAFPSGLACRGRKSAVEHIQLLSDTQLNHEKSSVSGIATFEIVWRAELDRSPLRVTNVHIHHRPAKKQQAYKAFWDKLAGDMLQYDSVLVVGDFNQSLRLTEADQKVLRPPRLQKLIRAFALAFSSSRVRLCQFYVTSAQLWHGYLLFLE